MVLVDEDVTSFSDASDSPDVAWKEPVVNALVKAMRVVIGLGVGSEVTVLETLCVVGVSVVLGVNAVVVLEETNKGWMGRGLSVSKAETYKSTFEFRFFSNIW